MWSRRTFLTTFGLTAAGAFGRRAGWAATPDDAPPPAEIVAQAAVGDGACGPCALANALTHGDASCRRAFASLEGGTAPGRVGTIIKRYGERPSETFGQGRTRYSKAEGTTTEDFPFLANELMRALALPEVSGQWLDVRAGENGRAHLRRVHGLLVDALAAGLPAMVEVRSFGANTTAEGGPQWDGLQGHWMPVVGVEPTTLPAQATGFVCRFADSATGTVIDGYAYAELRRAFTATHGFTVEPDGTRKWTWITGYPYILLQAPDLGLNTQKRLWHERTFFSLQYAVCRAGR